MKPLKLHFRDKLKQHVLLAISSENNMNGFFNERKGLICTKKMYRTSKYNKSFDSKIVRGVSYRKDYANNFQHVSLG